MKPACPHCDQPDMSLLRVVLIGEVLCADTPQLALLADVRQACGVLAGAPEPDVLAAARGRPPQGMRQTRRSSGAPRRGHRRGDRPR